MLVAVPDAAFSQQKVLKHKATHGEKQAGGIRIFQAFAEPLG